MLHKPWPVSGDTTMGNEAPRQRCFFDLMRLAGRTDEGMKGLSHTLAMGGKVVWESRPWG